MKINNKLLISHVNEITIEFCDLLEDGEHKTIERDVELFDGEKNNIYTTILCCKKDDIQKIEDLIDSFNGKNLEEYKLDKNICHITTYKKNVDRYSIYICVKNIYHLMITMIIWYMLSLMMSIK